MQKAEHVVHVIDRYSLCAVVLKEQEFCGLN